MKNIMGDYAFYLDYFTSATANVNVYDSDLTTVASGTESAVAWAELESGETYYVEVIMTSNYDYDFTIYAAPEGYSQKSAIEIDGDDTTVSGEYAAISANGAIWFEFTATESKYYNFSHDNYYYDDIYIYDENSSYLSSAYARTLNCYMTEGETYYIYIEFNSTYDPSFNLMIGTAGESRESAIAMTSRNTNYTVNITEGGQYVWFKINPPSNGTRYIYLTGMPSTAYAYLYNGTSTSYTAYNYGSTSFYVSSYLYSYNTYYVCVYLSSNYTGSFNIYYY